MDLPQELDDYMKESIEHSLGLPVSAQTLQLKLQASEESQRRLREQYIRLVSKLKEKDEITERARAESSMNAQALKKFVDENQKLAAECANLLSQCKRLERECLLYDRDREALMDFGNEADERAKEAEIRVQQLEEKLGRSAEELHLYKHEYKCRGLVDSSDEKADIEETLLESVLATFINKKEVASGHAFLEGNIGHESCQKLLKMWNGLRPSTQKVISLVAEVKTLEKNKEHLRINLSRAEEEAKLLFEANNILDEENKKLLRQYHREQNVHGSGGKHSCSASAKRNKRKSSPKMSSPVGKKIDFDDLDSTRYPLSPLRCNSPESRMHKT
ncbi:hypothetical protein HS088_TW11G00254 [Tripterygium wilfordii]|uniref:Uncharacterized protein n=1 Tax=Tripterygium wilfordii TaxID=458696 RepID=A0A7J7D1P2_TRIWF|nr:uncharacterized protein LOC120009094 [Tripterygium wilfordii]XP_038715476.1 uncharacterized protein LOC120009094 [Tripterygium wilfordii]XP_038715478.1 uncharacterized protein LOC120009094 [Tripterygium wilfordii]KAF5740188.1 hypothetical protein HS088_TW11G00254 [Tripterygium wilfordii]